MGWSIALSNLLISLLLLYVTPSLGQTSEFRSSITIEKELLKYLKLEISPDLRFTDGFGDREYQFRGGVSYRPVKYVGFTAAYRFGVLNYKGKETEYQNRYFVSAQLRYGLRRFDFTARAMLTNDGDAGFFDGNPNNYLRFKARIRYNIRSLKVSPYVHAEYFYQINDREFNRARYGFGGVYKLSKSHSISLEYCWQDYLKKQKNKNIFSLGYTYSL